MEHTTLRVEREGPIGRVVLARPERLNALNAASVVELRDAFGELGSDEDVRVIIMKGEGRAFCAGADYKDGGIIGPHPDSASELLHNRSQNLSMLFCLWDCPKPIIGQYQGYAIGWGGALSLFADLKYISDEFQIFQANGVTGAHMAQIWSWFIGITQAKEFEFRRANRWNARELVTMGYANRAFPLADLEEQVESIASEIAKTNPLFLQYQKLALNRQYDFRGFREHILSSKDLDAHLHWSTLGVENHRRTDEAGGDRRAMGAAQRKGNYW